ncbi:MULTISPECIES: hypothetical protein [Haloferax]|uniref:hypothetical protein n=1 Tax=Haloferax TaxID=2251 RepID=UPI000A772877|nr:MULTISPECIES: hypothetical protein [Haloferax]
MVRTRLTSPTFDRSASIPTVTYVLLITVLSGFLLAAPHGSPTPLLGLAWSGVLVALAAGALRVEGVALQSLFPSLRAFGAAVAVVAAFWALYNLVAAGLATAGVGGFEPVLSRVVAHPAPYLAALLSSFVLTALPEELLFRGYLNRGESPAVHGGRGSDNRNTTADNAQSGVSKSFAAWSNIPSHVRPWSSLIRFNRS